MTSVQLYVSPNVVLGPSRRGGVDYRGGLGGGGVRLGASMLGYTRLLALTRRLPSDLSIHADGLALRRTLPHVVKGVLPDPSRLALLERQRKDLLSLVVG
jgi:hypothetical protein